MNLKTLRPGDRVIIADRTECVFLGFSDTDVKYGDGGVRFAGWDDLRATLGVRSFKDLDAANEAAVALRGYGHGHYALFRDVDDASFVWGAYRFNGAWCFGSSAHRLGLRKVS